MILTVLLVDLDLDGHSFGFADFPHLWISVVIASEHSEHRQFRCTALLVRWAKYLRLDDTVTRNRLKMYCKAADELDQAAWPVISSEIWPELVWLKNQAIKHKLV